MSRLLAAFWVITHCSLIAAIFWAGVLAFPIATTALILRNADGYRRAMLTVDTVHYDSGANDEIGGASYWAMGWIAPGNGLERLSVHDFFETPPESQADVEKALHKGDALPVLFNPGMTDMMVQTETPRVLLEKGDVWGEKRSRLKTMLWLALVPSLATSLMVALARRLRKSSPLITLTTGRKV
jgi:hypothetical protein